MNNAPIEHSPELEEEINLILDLLEDASEAGSPISVEQACVRAPALVPIVRQRWAKLGLMDLVTTPPANIPLPSDLTELKKDPAYSDYDAGKSRLQGLVLEAKTHIAIESFHACGGLGEVYAARERDNTRRVALKILRSDRESRTNLLNFDRESKILARLNHPGIVSIYGSGKSPEGRPFYTMPFLREGNLEDHIHDYHRKFHSRIDATGLPFRELLSKLVNVCKAVAYAHSRGIAHRDLKPRNIMLGRYGEVWVIDWGAAWRFDRDVRFKTTNEESLHIESFQQEEEPRLISPRYASPEQYDLTSQVGPESDVYSLGAILYTVLCGSPPFAEVDESRVHVATRTGNPRAPSEWKAGIPRSLEAICYKAMQKRSSDRYKTLLDLSTDIERFLADEPVSVLADSLSLRAYRTLKRHSRGVFLAFATAAIFAGFVTTLLINQSILTRNAKEVAMQRLSLAATLASSVSGVELDRRWRVLETEAASPELLTALEAIRDKDKPEENARRLQGLLDRRSVQLQRIDGINHESLFVMDENGIQLARSPYSTESIGNNYSYRDYFHGQGKEFPKDTTHPPASNSVISIVYEGTDDRKMKVALSVPLFSSDVPNGISMLPIGRLCMSMEIYDLQIFKQIDHLPIHYMLVETRDYRWRESSATGLILDTNIPALASESIFENNAAIGSKGWKSEWLRKAISLNGDNRKLNLSINHDECAKVPIKVSGRGFPGDEIGWIILLSEDSQKK